MSQADLKGRWALILGASSGFGLATAQELARNGMNIIGLHLDRGPALEQIKKYVYEMEAMGVQVHYYNTNIANADKRADAIKNIQAILAQNPKGPQVLHVVMHSVAFGSLLPFIGNDPSKTLVQSQVEMTLDVMANSLVYWVQDLYRNHLLGRGSRVFSMTSAGSIQVFESYGAVSAAKAALESHTRQLALELGKYGILVNTIMAGVTDTPALRKIPGGEKLLEGGMRRNPGGRLTTTIDIAKTIRALSDPELEWINGATIVVDGGELISGI